MILRICARASHDKLDKGRRFAAWEVPELLSSELLQRLAAGAQTDPRSQDFGFLARHPSTTSSRLPLRIPTRDALVQRDWRRRIDACCCEHGSLAGRGGICTHWRTPPLHGAHPLQMALLAPK